MLYTVQLYTCIYILFEPVPDIGGGLYALVYIFPVFP